MTARLPAPRRVHLAPAAWAVLRSAGEAPAMPPGLDLTVAGLGLGEAEVARTRSALEQAGLLRDGVPVPAVAAALAVLAGPPVLLLEGAGSRVAAWGVRGVLAAGVERDGRALVLTLAGVEDLADLVTAACGEPGSADGGPGAADAPGADGGPGPEVLLPAAGAVAVVRAWETGRGALAAEIGGAGATALADLTGPLAEVVRLRVGTLVLLLLRGHDRWWTVRLLGPAGDPVVGLTPLGPGGARSLVVDLLAGAMVATR